MTQARRSATASDQLSGQRTFMTQAAARQLMENPVQVTRGRVTRITLIVPTFESPNRQRRRAYLVAHIPQARVNELMQHLGTLPEGERAGFIRSYIRANQQAMISTYLGNRRARFRFDPIAPGSVSGTAARQPRSPTPRRTATPPPQERARSPTPRRSTPQPQVSASEPEERAVPGPRPRARAPPEIAVTGGRGTRSSPYVVEFNLRRASSGTGGQRIDIPLHFSIGGSNYRYSVQVTLNQIAESRIQDTYSRIMRHCRRHLGGLHGGRVQARASLAAFRDNIRTTFGSMGARGRRFISYLDNN